MARRYPSAWAHIFVFRRKWVQGMKYLSNKKMRFLSLIRLCVKRAALMAGLKV